MTRLTRPLTPLLCSPHHRILLSPRAKLSFPLLSRASYCSPRRPTMGPIPDTRRGGGGAAVIEDSAADDYVRVERPSEGGDDDDDGNPNSGVEGNEGDEVLLGRNVVTLSCQNVDGFMQRSSSYYQSPRARDAPLCLSHSYVYGRVLVVVLGVIHFFLSNLQSTFLNRNNLS